MVGTEWDIPIVFGTLIALDHRSSGRAIDILRVPLDRAALIGILAGGGVRSGDDRAATNAAGSKFKPRVHAFAGFNFAICSVTSSSVAHPRKYRQIIS